MSDEGKVRVFISSVSSNHKIKKQQMKIKDVLDSKKIEYEWIDITSDDEAKQEMRDGCSDPTAIPPHIFNGSTYLGNYEAFEDAVEMETLHEFLHITQH